MTFFSSGSWSPLWVPDWYPPRVSQHMFDPHSFIHILHGIILHLLVGRLVSVWLGLVMVILTEVSWEVLENTDLWMENKMGKERNQEKESIQHVIGAVICCVFGYLVSSLFLNIGAWWLSILWIVASEVGCFSYMGDNLIIMIVLMIFKVKDFRGAIVQNQKFLEFAHSKNKQKFLEFVHNQNKQKVP